MELLTTQICNGSITYLVEVVRHYLRVQAYGDALHSLCEQQGEFHRQSDRFLVTSVIGHLPLRRLGIEDRLKGKFAQSGLNITGRSSTGTSQDITPVTLCINKQVFLTQLHQCIANRSITMRMELHGVSYDIRHLVIPSVIHALHRVQDTPLNGFQTILYMRNGTFEDYVRGIIQEPVLVHTTKVVYGRSIKAITHCTLGIFLPG